MIATIVATAMFAGSLGTLIGAWRRPDSVHEAKADELAAQVADLHDELRCERAAHKITRHELRNAESRLAWTGGLGGGAA